MRFPPHAHSLRRHVNRLYLRARARYLLRLVRVDRSVPGRWIDAAIVAAVAVAAPLLAWGAYRASLAAGYSELAAQSAPQLALYAASVEWELRRYDQLVALLAANANLIEFLQGGHQVEQASRISKSLTRAAETSGVRELLVLDPAGQSVAASDWFLPTNGIGDDHSGTELFRRAAQEGEAGLFRYAGSDSGPTEYQYIRLIRDAGRVIGAIALRASLERMESAWLSKSGLSRQHQFIVLDEHDVVVLTSAPELQLRSTRNLSLGEREALRESRRYRDELGAFRPLTTAEEEQVEAGRLIRIAFRGDGGPLVRYLAQEQAIARPTGRAVLLTDASGVRTDAQLRAAAAGGGVLLAGVLALYLLQFRRESQTRRTAREMLQRANDELGRRVEERTAELRSINRELMREIGEREKAEAVLRTAQEELVQAGKLALLGQMAAGVAHEVNQPLMAMRALADNARILMQRGNHDTVLRNLEAIAGLTDRLGRISSQLKGFSRKSPGIPQQVQAEGPVRNALALLDNRLKSEHVGVSCSISALTVECDPVRLEQVVVNLVSNAIDAMKPQAREKRIAITARQQGDRGVIRVEDNGPGVPAEQAGRLFEPFHTTKPQGEGLGLGLAISASIVNEFGGTLKLVPSDGGAAFEIELRTTKATQT